MNIITPDRHGLGSFNIKYNIDKSIDKDNILWYKVTIPNCTIHVDSNASKDIIIDIVKDIIERRNK